jgi:hypothetical protein
MVAGNAELPGHRRGAPGMAVDHADELEVRAAPHDRQVAVQRHPPEADRRHA